MAAFAWCMNGLVNEEARRYCEGCQIDDPSQLHHDCMTMEQEENWICYYERAKARLKVENLWSEIDKKNAHKTGCVFRRLMVEIFPSTSQGGCDQRLFIL